MTTLKQIYIFLKQMNLFGKDLKLCFFFLVRTEERCCFTWFLKVTNMKISFENKLAIYTKISEIEGWGKVTRITKKVNLSIKQLYLQHLFELSLKLTLRINLTHPRKVSHNLNICNQLQVSRISHLLCTLAVFYFM